jgi:hypothetical protein
MFDAKAPAMCWVVYSFMGRKVVERLGSPYYYLGNGLRWPGDARDLAVSAPCLY